MKGGDDSQEKVEIVSLQKAFTSDAPLRCIMKIYAEALKCFQCGQIIRIIQLHLEDLKHNRANFKRYSLSL